MQQKKKTASALVGQKGEEAAVLLLKKKGYAILVRNWRPAGVQQGLELDIVAKQRDMLVFVEVKTRTCKTEEGIPPLAAFTRSKQQKMVRAAREYLAANNVWEKPCRFDVVCVTINAAEHVQLEHFEHVIEVGNCMDSGNTSWQPW